jgi:Lrp/AsnC family leucine-responsive transcriptional regulator
MHMNACTPLSAAVTPVVERQRFVAATGTTHGRHAAHSETVPELTMQKTSNAAKKPDGEQQSPRRSTLDRIDRQILERLQEDGRVSISQLAREVHLTVTPCFERVKRLEADGYISGYFAHLNPDRLGLGLLAYIAVTLHQGTPDIFERFMQSIREFEEVLECHMVAGGYDYLVKVRVKDMQAYRKFLGDRLGNLRGLSNTRTYFVMEEIKSSHCLAVQP